MVVCDWVWFGNLYFQDGVWEGECILFEGYVEWVIVFVEVWVVDGCFIYGGFFFWVGGESLNVLFKSVYQMFGVGGQSMIVLLE